MVTNDSAAGAAPARIAVGPIGVRAVVLAAMVAGGVGIYRRSAPRFDDGFWAFALAVAIPVLVLFGAWLLREAFQQGADRRALRRARSGPGHPRRGDWVAVAGEAVALEEPFAAPISGRPALACAYQVVLERSSSSSTSATGRSTSRRLLCEGYHLAPTAIEGERGRVLLRGFPDLLDLPPSALASEQQGEARRGPHAATRGPTAFRFAARARLLAGRHERLHVDWRYAEDEAVGRPQRKERVLEPGARICVFGRWGEGELLPSAGRPRGLPVYAGSFEEVLAKVGLESRVQLVMAGIALAVAAGLAWMFVL